ncbi:CAP domain-containing protein [Aquamicrobium segne]|uniref:CAP domain-containing protein n=1 Tax=Aquamicrobium segne TaxID=469547 RepID=A0ABW0GWI5_9HYPH
MKQSLALPAADTPCCNRRTLILGAGAFTLAGLAGCGSLPGKGAGGGASASAQTAMMKIRKQAGLSALSSDHQLERAALQQAHYMAASGRMDHTTGIGKGFAARIKSNRIKGAVAENIAEGRMDSARAITMWMNSAPHRRNMLDGRFTRFGLAWASHPSRPEWRYWAIILAS